MPEKEFATLTTEVKAAAEADDRTLRFIGTTAARDRMGDEVTLSGWDFKAFRKNPVFLWAHDYRALPIGKVTKIAKDDIGNGEKGWTFDVNFAPADANPVAEQCLKLARGGYLNAVSVGFQSHASKWIEEDEEAKDKRKKETPDKHPGKVFLKKELLELSLVPVPANAEALQVARKKGMELPAELNAALDSIALERASEALANTREIKAQLARLEGNDPDEKDLEGETITKPGWDDEEGANEIKYRVREPGRFKDGTLKRIALQKQKPRVIAIVGNLKGQDSLTIQALRFPKDDGWNLNKAKAWLKDHPDVVKQIDGLAEEIEIESVDAWIKTSESVLADIEDTRDEATDVALPEGENAEPGAEVDAAAKTTDTPALPPEENADNASDAGGPEYIRFLPEEEQEETYVILEG